jgi:hypothetical protein
LQSFLLAFLLAAAACAQAVELTTARAVEDAAARPQEVDFTGAPLETLPDNWRRTRSPDTATVWYSVPLDDALAAVRSRDGLAVVVPRVAEEGAFWLNGEPLSPAYGFGAARNRTVWIDLPAAALRASGNTLEVRVQGVPQVRSGLSEIRLGPAAELRLGYEARHVVQTTLPLGLLLALPAAFLVALALWLKTRRGTHLLFMALCVLLLPRAAVMATPFAGLPLIAPLAVLVALTSLAATTLVALLGLDYLEGAAQFRRDYRRAVIVSAVLCGAAAVGWATIEPLTPRTFGLLYLPIFANLVVLALAHARVALLAPRAAVVCTALALLAWTAAAAHDLAMLNDLTDFDSFFWSPAGIVLVFLAFAWRSLETYFRNTSPPAARRG